MSDTTPPAPEQTLAPHHLRLFALLVDYLLIVIALNLSQQILLGAHWDLSAPPENLWQEIWPRLAAGLLLLALRDALGASPGKWWMGLTVRRAEDPTRRPEFAALVTRQLTLPLLPLEAVWVFVDPFYRRLGDRLAGTVVVTNPSPAFITRRMLAFLVVLLAALLAGLVVAPWNMRRSAAYQAAERAIAAHPDVARLAGPGAALEEVRTFDLDLRADPARATIRFQAQGERRSAEGELVLRMTDSPRRWEIATFTLDEPKLAPSDAPPAPGR